MTNCVTVQQAKNFIPYKMYPTLNTDSWLLYFRKKRIVTSTKEYNKLYI